MADKKPANAETASEKPPATARATLEAGTATGTNSVDFEKTRDVVDERVDALSKQNEEGHAKNMKRIDDAHKGNEDREGEDRVSGADPKLGREDNGNTPRIDRDGNKSWHPPGVAGAAR